MKSTRVQAPWLVLTSSTLTVTSYFFYSTRNILVWNYLYFSSSNHVHLVEICNCSTHLKPITGSSYELLSLPLCSVSADAPTPDKRIGTGTRGRNCRNRRPEPGSAPWGTAPTDRYQSTRTPGGAGSGAYCAARQLDPRSRPLLQTDLLVFRYLCLNMYRCNAKTTLYFICRAEVNRSQVT